MSAMMSSSGTDTCTNIAVDSSGNAYVGGSTRSTDFPVVNPIQATPGGGSGDAFLTKLNASGSALVYSTYLGGSQGDLIQAVGVDSAGNAYVAGNTDSANFPTANALQATFGGGSDVFVAKLNAAGTAFFYSTYLGGSGLEFSGWGLGVDSAGNVTVAGETGSFNFPTANAIQATPTAGGDAFVTRINAAGTALVYSTYLGGGSFDEANDIALGPDGSAYVSGTTSSTNFPTVNAFQATLAGVGDAFVAKLNAAGNLVYSTYLGGSDSDGANGIAVGADGGAVVVGSTVSTNFPVFNPVQATRNGPRDAFVTKLNAAGNALVYSTYLGGSASGGAEAAFGVAVDSAGSAYVSGRTPSTDFPTVTPIQATYGGGTQDVFLTKIGELPPGSSIFQFGRAIYSVDEDVAFVTLIVTRGGDTSTAATVDYSTADGTASELADYTTALGTLRFAAGEQSKAVVVLINEDSKAEGTESFTVTLSNPTGPAALGGQSSATVQITDDGAEPATNVIDDPVIFVGTHYHDFFGRQHDQPGLDFWSNQIIECGANAACVDVRRQNVSGAFFTSIEFQETGYLVYRTHKAAFGNLPGVTWPLTMRSLLYDMGQIGAGVIVGQPGWEQQLEANKVAYFASLVQRPAFVTAYPPSMTAAQFVDKLNQNAGGALSQDERDDLVNKLTSAQLTRAQVVRAVAEDRTLYDAEYRRAFVYMQYVGYLRRDPDQLGFDFWLGKLNDHGGDYISSEMIRSFLVSGEYRGRFGN